MKDQKHPPPVWQLLQHPRVAAHLARLGHERVVAAIRETIDAQRRENRIADNGASSLDAVAQGVARRLEIDQPALKTVINATGVLLHTGLGRAPLSRRVADHVAGVAAGYSALELDLETGARGRRHAAVAKLLREVTGAESAIVVNNNAAATLLVLRVVAKGREVIVSRGQLIEIGGEFRLPEIFEVSGAILREVGTTNKTRIEDYERAIGPQTAAILRVHPSNYRVEGFCQSVPIAPLCALAHERGLACIDDIGSGALRPGHAAAFAGEPTIAESVDAGSDLILCSGDKLLGGPQAGIILGAASWIDRLGRDPVMRALRVDKMTLAALELTLRDLRSDAPRDPEFNLLWHLISASQEELRHRAEAVAARVATAPEWRLRTVESAALLGGGSCPGTTLGSWALQIEPAEGRSGKDVAALSAALRRGEPAIVGRVQDAALWLDMRTILPAQDAALADALARGLVSTAEDFASANLETSDMSGQPLDAGLGED